MEDRKFYRIIQRKNRSFVVDLDGNPLPPDVTCELGKSLAETANQKAYVYFGKRQSGEAYKIGRTEDLQRRSRELGITFVHTIECDLYGDFSSVKVESALHEFFAEERLEGEWFDLADVELQIAIQRFKTGKETLTFIKEFREVYLKNIALLHEAQIGAYVAKVARLFLLDEWETEHDLTAPIYILDKMRYHISKKNPSHPMITKVNLAIQILMKLRADVYRMEQAK